MSDVASNRPDALEQCKSAHRALAVLRMLGREPSYASNEEIIDFYFAQLGLTCPRARVRDCLEMLERSGLIEISKVETLMVVRLTAKGEEAGSGLVEVDGVLKPGIDCSY